MTGFRYDKITRYMITACCEGPLHIGSAVGSREEVLIDPVSNTPFVQASSIAGVFRSYCKDFMKDARWIILFGTNSVENMSRLRFEDAHFIEKCKMEYRPHVSINTSTGSVSSGQIKGTDKTSGQKFNMEYVGSGSQIEFSMYLYEDSKSNDNLSELTMNILAAMKNGILQFGGKKSNGNGCIKLIALKAKEYNLQNDEERKAWMDLTDSDLVDIYDNLKDVNNERNAYEIIINGTTENYIQVKGLVIQGNGKGAADSQNMQNALKEYIVPGSSFKGTIRAQMEKISGYIECENIIEESFGKTLKSGENGKTGNLIFYDTVIGDRESNDKMPLENRIHIDKFTGGVFNSGLFNEKNSAGDVSFKINILNKNNPDKTLGLLLFALRDLAIGVMSIGNGYNIGKGFIDVSRIMVTRSADGKEASIYKNDDRLVTSDDNQVIKKAIEALKGGC